MSLWKRLTIDCLEFLFRIIWIVVPFFRFWQRIYRLSMFRRAVGFPVPASTQFDGPVDIIGSGLIKLGEYCRLGLDVQLETNGYGEIILGHRVRINTGTLICAHQNVYIGDDTLIGEYVSIRDANHGIQPDQLIRTQPHQSAAILIGRGVWIGRGCCILKGVSIGDGAVIGANSVVTKDIPENSVYMGIPATFYRTR